MSGYTKHEYRLFIQDIKKELQKYLRQIAVVLPREYAFEDIKKAIEQYFPFEWRIICERYREYSRADIKLEKFGKKKRYNMSSPQEILKALPETRILLNAEAQKKHCEYFGSEDWEWAYNSFTENRQKKNSKRQVKIDKALDRAQKVEPNFLDKLIGLYDRKGTSQKDRVYIIVELEKYYCEKTITFFQRIAHSEVNFQIREEAVKHLLSLGHYAKLRKQKYMQSHVSNKERRKEILHTYAREKFSIDAIPQELEYRINNSREQQLKSYDFFVSHSYQDHLFVQQWIDTLNGSGKNVYCDWISDSDYLKRNLICDATLEVIEKRIAQSKAVLFLASKNSYNSVWVKYELNYADEIGKEIYYVDAQSIDNDEYRIEPLTEKWYLVDDYKNIRLIPPEKEEG